MIASSNAPIVDQYAQLLKPCGQYFLRYPTFFEVLRSFMSNMSTTELTGSGKRQPSFPM
jgi:hypothetical protein